MCFTFKSTHSPPHSHTKGVSFAVCAFFLACLTEYVNKTFGKLLIQMLDFVNRLCLTQAMTSQSSSL